MEPELVGAIYRREAARVLATLIRLLGDFDLAEESRQDAFAAALEQWPSSGVPLEPRAWLVHVGRNKGIDRIRRAAALRDRVTAIADETSEDPLAAVSDPGEIDLDFGDDRLRLIFTCCHPTLNVDAQIALTLHAVCGMHIDEISRLFLLNRDTMWQRVVRAKRKIRDAAIPYETPPPAVWNERIAGVLAVVYLIFTEGYSGTSGSAVVRDELCDEAIRLGRLIDALLPGRGDVNGLLALMLLHHSRSKARVSAAGDILLLAQQDRRLWDRAQAEEGLGLVEQALRSPTISSYAVQAAIAALHAKAEHPEDTDWPQIVSLYEVLLRLQPSPVIELNHAVAVSMVDGPTRALPLIESLSARSEMGHYHLLHAARAEMLRQLGRTTEACAAYRSALDLVSLEPERRLLERRLSELHSNSLA